MKTLNELLKINHSEPEYRGEWVQYIGIFPNGYGISIVSHKASYGGNGGLYEAALLEWNTGDGSINWSLAKGHDVKGWLTAKEAIQLAGKVKKGIFSDFSLFNI